jgi:hypothetical protein
MGAACGPTALRPISWGALKAQFGPRTRSWTGSASTSPDTGR